MATIIKLDGFTRSYIEAALWSSTDENDAPLDANYTVADIAEESLQNAIADCEQFQHEQRKLLNPKLYLASAGRWSVLEMAGHDFWLTRHHHGAGFWDGDWQTFAGERLTTKSHQYPECYLHVGDDGKIHGF